MWEIRFEQELYRHNTKVWLVKDAGTMNPGIVDKVVDGDITFHELPGTTTFEIPHPTFNLVRNDFQYLSEAWAQVAWEQGWRPKDYVPSEATLRHLEDMRKIVAKKVGVEL